MDYDDPFSCCFLIIHPYIWYPLGVGWLGIFCVTMFLYAFVKLSLLCVFRVRGAKFPVAVAVLPLVGNTAASGWDIFDQGPCSQYANECYQSFGMMVVQFFFGTVQIVGILVLLTFVLGLLLLIVYFAASSSPVLFRSEQSVEKI